MADNSLGYMREYGHIIIPLCIICYMGLYTYLCQEYGEIDDEWWFSQAFYQKFNGCCICYGICYGF